MGLPFNNQYKVIVGAASGAVSANTMNYDAVAKVFTNGTALITNSAGCGSIAFQRQDGYWIIMLGDAAAAATNITEIVNPYNGTTAVGPTLSASVGGRGQTVIPRSDGTFLITVGAFNASSTNSQIYFRGVVLMP